MKTHADLIEPSVFGGYNLPLVVPSGSEKIEEEITRAAYIYLYSGASYASPDLKNPALYVTATEEDEIVIKANLRSTAIV